MWHATPCVNRRTRYSPATVPCRATMTETHTHFSRFFLDDSEVKVTRDRGLLLVTEKISNFINNRNI